MNETKIFIIIIAVVLLLMGGIIIFVTMDNEPELITSDSDIVLNDEGRVEISTNNFMSMMVELQINRADYIGKEIEIEGFVHISEHNGELIYGVVRRTAGCCGDDGPLVGIEFRYEGEKPKENDWIRIIGVIGSSQNANEDDFMIINATEITVMEERGQEVI